MTFYVGSRTMGIRRAPSVAIANRNTVTAGRRRQTFPTVLECDPIVPPITAEQNYQYMRLRGGKTECAVAIRTAQLDCGSAVCMTTLPLVMYKCHCTKHGMNGTW